MGLIETRVINEFWNVDRRLAELGLDRQKLLRVRSKALAAASDATAFHAINAAGTYSYHSGIYALRDEFVGELWSPDRTDGVEFIRSEKTKVKVGFANVDIASHSEREPKPRSRKGAGSERITSGNLFGNLPRYAPSQIPGWSIYYLMVDERGGVELSCPVVRGSTFVAFVERICLSDGSDFDGAALLPLDEPNAINDFDPKVARK